MPLPIKSAELPGLPAELAKKFQTYLKMHSPESAWKIISSELITSGQPFDVHLAIFKKCFPHWPDYLDSAPVWSPDENAIKQTNLGLLLTKLNLKTVKEFYRWSITQVDRFWQEMLNTLGIIFQKQPHTICDLTTGIESPNWLPGAKLNIVESCFTANSSAIAIKYYSQKKSIKNISYGELNLLSNQIANSLLKLGYVTGDAIAIDMPMTPEAIAIYLGIIKMGGSVVSIADSFSPAEIATRLEITKTKAIFTQDFILRDNKTIPLYEKVITANAPQAIILPSAETLKMSLRQNDLEWNQFLVTNNKFSPNICDPLTTINILFSSGTTGTPKAIPWNHTTAIKAASDAWLHQNIQPGDILAWPTNLGWMMGPWLIFAALINQATIALYDGIPKDRHFGEFVATTKVTMLGVVPTLVASWRETKCMEGLDWSSIKLFSSTGECSNPEDMFYLMYLAGYKPIIEYCGGTEIGGAYISSTMLEKNYPSVFTTPAMGTNFILLDEMGNPTDNGEVALVPPAMGLSFILLNADHHQIYFANMPLSPNKQILRRHGDQALRLKSGNYSLLGRIDDTMNLGAIKVSSAEIERVLSGMENIIETAAIGANPTQGPSRLIIFAATTTDLDKEEIKKEMQKRINQHLNPLFKIYDVIFVKELPKTASNKIMRKNLRHMLQNQDSNSLLGSSGN